MSKPRLLFFLHSLTIGGTERLVLQLCHALEQQYEIGICCLDQRGALWELAESRHYQLFLLNRSPGWQLRTFTCAREVYKSFVPDIVHAHQYAPYLYAVSGKVLSRSKAPIVFTEHGRHFPDIVSPKRRVANIALQHFAAKITAVSQFSKDALIQKEGFTKVPIEVLYNGLAFDADSESTGKSIHAELGIAQDTPLIGYLGSLRAVKNPSYLIKAFSLLAQRELHSHLVLIGDGPLRKELELQVQHCKLSDRIHFLGAKTPATPYLNSLSILTLPSLSEAASLAILEGMARGIPVVATDTGGNPELIDHGKNGMLVPCGAPERYAETLLCLLEDSQLRETLGTEAKQCVASRFSFAQMCAGYDTYYRSLGLSHSIA